MVDEIKAQNETSTTQKFTNLQIVGDLSASTTCLRQLLGCCDQLVEGGLCLLFHVFQRHNAWNHSYLQKYLPHIQN